MKFLWVEDFNDGSGDKDELQRAWMKYFNLKDVVLKETMDEALEYLECPDHFRQFDGILLDIRFPIIGAEVYGKYFSRFVTRELYDKYQNSGAGILLYLALVFRYHYSQERIAFVSANVDDKRLEPLLVMEDLVIKSKYEELSRQEWDRYDKAEDSLAKIYLKDTGNIELGLNDSIPWDGGKYLWEVFDKQTQKDQFLARLEQVRDEINRISQAGMYVKYNYVRQLFYQLGLIIPEAFTKPSEDCGDMSWAFFQWKRLLASPYYKLRRNVMEMCLILVNHMSPELVKQCRDSGDQMKQILDHLCRTLPNAGDRGEEYVEGFVKEVAVLDEQGKYINLDKKISIRQACCLVIKLTRNWVFHQGIEGLTKNAESRMPLRRLGDAGFLFTVALRGYFDLAELQPDQYQEYRRYERELLSLLGPETPVQSADLETRLRSSFEKLLHKNKSAFANSTAAKTHIYRIVSGIGHENSKFCRQVSMDELYQLFWHLMCSCVSTGAQATSADRDIFNILKHTYRQTWEDNRYISAE